MRQSSALHQQQKPTGIPSARSCTHGISEAQQELLEDEQVPAEKEAHGADLGHPPAHHVRRGAAAEQLGQAHAQRQVRS